jgi:hypothetical protein
VIESLATSPFWDSKSHFPQRICIEALNRTSFTPSTEASRWSDATHHSEVSCAATPAWRKEAGPVIRLCCPKLAEDRRTQKRFQLYLTHGSESEKKTKPTSN